MQINFRKNYFKVYLDLITDSWLHLLCSTLTWSLNLPILISYIHISVLGFECAVLYKSQLCCKGDEVGNCIWRFGGQCCLRNKRNCEYFYSVKFTKINPQSHFYISHQCFSVAANWLHVCTVLPWKCAPPSCCSFNSPFESPAALGAVSHTVLAAVFCPLNDFWGQCVILQA